MLLKYR